MFGRHPHQGGGGRGHESLMTNSQRMALWLAILFVVLSAGYLWTAANFLTEHVLANQIDHYQIIHYAPFVIWFILAMIVLYSSRMGLASSFALGMIWLLSKLPVF